MTKEIWMEMLRRDFRYALRQIARAPGLTLVTVLTLALGIGANTAIFSVVEGVLLRRLPYSHEDRLVHLGKRGATSGADDLRFSVLELADYRQQSRALAAILEYHSMGFTLLGRDEPDEVQTGIVSANFFPELGIEPLLGRTFRPEEDQPGAPPVLVLSHAYWLRRFGGDPGVVGRSLQMNGKQIVVVGVLPPLPSYPGADDVFIPISSCPFRNSDRVLHRREARLLRLFGRLKPGETLAHAEADLSTIARRLHQEYPASYKKDAFENVPVVAVRDDLTHRFRPTLLILLGTVGLVLLLACANVANLGLARLIAREREIVVRAAMGASRGRLVRQLLTESTLLALLGGCVGVFLAWAGMRFLVSFAQRFTPRASEITIDGPVLLFTLLLAIGTGLVFGSVPALQATRRELVNSLRQGSGQSRGRAASHGTQAFLIVLQVAVSFILLIGSGLTLRSVVKMQRLDPGFKPEKVVTLTVTLPLSKYRKPPDFERFFEDLSARIAAHPNVVSVAVASDGPLNGGLMNPTFKIENRPAMPNQEPQATFHVASPDYFRTLGIPLLRGRTFTRSDHGEAPLVTVVSQSMARQFWPDEDPIGKRIAMTNLGAGDWRTIIGIVGDVKQHGLRDESDAGFYYPFLQAPGLHMQLFVRTTGNPDRMFKEIRQEVHGLDPDQPITAMQTLAEVKSDVIAPYQLTATLLSLFAVLAFVVTATGVSGVVAFDVTQRTQEIGIRTALGARPRAVVSLVLRQGMSFVAIGLVVGAFGAFYLTQFLASLLFGVEPTDPATFLVISFLLIVNVGFACFVPARRAAHVDPAIALRSV
jgi:putative ABC transport system permease protein